MKRILFSILMASQFASLAYAATDGREKLVLDEASQSIKKYAEVYESALPQLNKENIREVCAQMLSSNTKALASRLNKADKEVRGLELKGRDGVKVSEIVMKTAALALDAQSALAKACQDNSLVEDQNILLNYYRSLKMAKTDLAVSRMALK